MRDFIIVSVLVAIAFAGFMAGIGQGTDSVPVVAEVEEVRPEETVPVPRFDALYRPNEI